MDPEATLRDLLSAVEEGDSDRVNELSQALERWIEQAGYPPKTIGPWKLGMDWHAAMTRCICQLAGIHVRLVQSRKGGHDVP